MTGKPTYEELEQRIQELEKAESERKVADKAQRETNQLLECVLNGVPDIIGIQNPDHSIVRYNNAGYKALDMTQEEVVGRTCFSLIGRTKECEECATSLALKSKKLEIVERFVPELGRYFLCRSNPVLDDNGKVRLIVEQLHDVTERIQVEDALRESEAKYRSLTENMNDILWTADLGMNTSYVSPSIEKVLGFTVEERLKQSLQEHMPPETLQMAAERLTEELEFDEERDPERCATLELDYYHKDGSLRCLETTLSFIRDEHVKPVGIHGMSRDITDRKHVEEALRKTSESLQAILDNSPLLISEFDLEGRYIRVNRAVTNLFKRAPSELVGKTFSEVLPSYLADQFIKRIARVLNVRRPITVEDYLDTPETDQYFITTVFPLFDASGAIRSIGAIAHDITERKRAEEALQESEEKYRRIYENSVVGFFQSTPEGRFLGVNPAFAKMLGYESPEELVSSVSDIASQTYANPGDRSRYHKALEADGYAEDFELKARCRDDSEIWVSDSSRAEFDEDGKIVRYEGIVVDITDRKRAEDVIRKSEQEKSLILDNASEIIAFHNKDRRFIWANRAYLEGVTSITGLPATVDDLKGKKCYEAWGLTNDCTNCPVMLALETGKPQEGELTPENQEHWPATQGSWLVRAAPVRDSIGALVGVIEISNDITERKADEAGRDKLKARLAQAHKMEAIGTLAGGIAHDFNNILSIIVGNTELAMLDVPEWSPAQDNLKEVREASLRARELVKQILMFARQKEHTVSNIRLEPIARESIKMLRASIPTTVKIHTKIKKGLPPALADPTEIQQIIMNLCTNAGQVMEAEGGTLTFSLDSVDFDTQFVTVAGVLPPGQYVRMQVRDTGPGIPPEIMERLFDPFFTTKGVGEGTGLGLAVVHGIVQDRRGGIIVESEEGRGTTFTIYLPASDVESAEVTVDQKKDLPRGTERVLFVDDEPMIMKMGQHMLERLGYIVEIRASGTDGLECFSQDPHRFDLVVTDMTMPGMRGDRLVEEILAIRPDIPVILCTGYSKQISKDKAQEMGIRAFVMKPLTQHELANTVREVLDE
jgi:PAS domain S-box-containing protein